MASKVPDLKWLGEWIEAHPIRKGWSLDEWRGWIVSGLQEKPDGYFTKLSKSLSYMLRHGAKEQGLALKEDGTIRVADLLAHYKFKAYSEDDIEITVLTNAKERFGMHMENEMRIVYCKQGHSKKLGIDPLRVRGMTALAPAKVPVSADHGTFKANLASIRTEGLKAVERPMHFAVAGGKSGVRNDSEVYLRVAVRQAAYDGIPFFMSENGVLLTEGWDGILPSKYINEVLYETPGQNRTESHHPEPARNHALAQQSVGGKPKRGMNRWTKATKDHAEVASRDLSSHIAVGETTVQNALPTLLPHRDFSGRNLDLAKKISKVIRHQKQALGLTLDKDGFICVKDLLKLRRFADASEDDIWHEASEDKVRFDVKCVGGLRMLRAAYKDSEKAS